MKKKLLTLAMAAVMVVSSAVSAFAEDIDCSGWWVAHSEGVEVTEEGVEVTFTNTTYESAAANWNGPLWVLYSGTEAKVNGADYAEYWVMRGDNYGWGNAAYYNGGADINTNTADAMTAAGITWTPDADATWDNFLTDLKAGVECTATAKLVGSNAVVTFSVAGVDTTIELPVDTSKTTYLSITGELTNITNITSKSMATTDDTTPSTDDTTSSTDDTTSSSTTTTTTTPDTGDYTMVGLLLAVAAVSAVVVLKRRTVAE